MFATRSPGHNGVDPAEQRKYAEMQFITMAHQRESMVNFSHTDMLSNYAQFRGRIPAGPGPFGSRL